MNFTDTKALSEKQKLEIIELWNKEYPKGLSLAGLVEFEKYLDDLLEKNHLLLSDENGSVKAGLSVL